MRRLQIANGESCEEDGQCASGLCIDFKCSDPLPDGAFCSDDAHCASALCVLGFCSAGLDGQTCTPEAACSADLVCIDASCQAKKEDGAYCANLDERCVSELCVLGSCSSGAAGQTCTPEAPCADDLVCIDASCQAKKEDGAYCAEFGERCVSELCVLGTCSSGAAGQTCTPEAPCADGLACMDSSCKAKLAEGAFCVDPEHCDAGFCLFGRCSVASGDGDIPDGQACGADEQCLSGICVNSLCSPPLVDQERCADPNHCASLACVQGFCTAGALDHACTPDDACAADLVCVDFKCQAKLEDGAYCANLDERCVSELCVLDSCSSGAADQTCTPDAPCANDLVCIGTRCQAKLENGLYCGTSSDNCVSELCVAGLCSSGALGETCAPDAACEAELVCLNGRCRAKLPEGQYCADAEHCESGFCLFEKCSAASGEGDIPDDDYCEGDEQCLSGICLNSRCSAPLANGLYCASPDHCESASCVLGFCSSGGVGESCTPTDACATEDLVCMDSKCQAKLDDGLSCFGLDERCVSGACVVGVCTSGGDGQTCDPAAACADDLVCINSKCQAKLEDGQYCGEDGGICASALCVTSFCTSGADGQTCDPAAACEAELVCLDGRCRAKLPDGQFCVDAEHCESGFCLFQKCSTASGVGDIPDGDYCEGGDQCLSGICLNSKCSAPLADGLYCYDAAHCESLACVMGFCSSGADGQHCTPDDACATEDLICVDSRCRAKLPEGQYCMDAAHCESGFCLFDKCSSASGVGDIPDGQTCATDDQCLSGICLNAKCSAPLEDGAYCANPDHCVSTSCVQGFCSSGQVDQWCTDTDPCATEDLVCIFSKCSAKLGEGEYCIDAEHCESGFCLFEKCSSASGVGDIPDGQTCATDDQCLSGICLNAKCSAPLEDGTYCANPDHCVSAACVQGLCTSGEVGQSCSATDPCATEDLFCLNYKCNSKLAEGEYCSDAEHCESGFCLFQKCSSASGVGDIPDGQTCATDDQCLSGICINAKCSAALLDGAFCTNPDHCVSTACVQGFCSSGQLDQWCTATDPCATEDLVCIDSKCSAPLEDGAYCANPDHCVSAACVQGLCTSGEDGQSCSATDPCATEDLFCLNYKCNSKLAEGEYCSDAEHCESGFCLFQKCSLASGVGDIPDGQTCATDDQCLSGVCINAKCSAALLDGAICTNPDHCVSTACVQGFCSSGQVDQWCTDTDPCATEDLVCIFSKCSAKLADGQTCWLADQCESGFCVFGSCSSTSSIAAMNSQVEDAEWYVDWQISKCVQSCTGPPPCGGLRDWWTAPHGTMAECCDAHLDWLGTYEGCSL